MKSYKKFLGMVVNGKVIDSIVQYFDFSTEKVERAFVIVEGKNEYAVNCELFVNNHSL